MHAAASRARRPIITTALLWALGLAVAGLWAGCANPPQRPALPPSSPIAGLGDTTLAAVVLAATPDDSRQLSGFRLLADGEHALDARLALIRHAERTLDVQYYLLAPDAAGRRFLRALRDAAERGVRVRLLLDDLHSVEADALLAGLAAHDNVQVRLFNPLPWRVGSPLARLALAGTQFERLQRRMHNKLLIADGRVAISGGRNIADEYFMQSRTANFVDVDLLNTGAVLPLLSRVFERYWHNRHAQPWQAVRGGVVDAAAARAQFAAQLSTLPEDITPGAPDAFGRSALGAQLAHGELALQFAAIEVLADPPEKMHRPTSLDDSALGSGLARLREAHWEVVIVSPYFVPGVSGLEMMREAAGAGLQIRVLTNSMAATDEPLVHHAYAGYRRAMLDLGVVLHELNPALLRKTAALGDFRSSDARLHAKVAVADRRWVLLGSMNMDGRSARANTELGLWIDSSRLAEELRVLLDPAHASGSYRLRAAASGIEWVVHDGAGEQVLKREPDEDWWLQMRLALLALFVGEERL